MRRWLGSFGLAALLVALLVGGAAQADTRAPTPMPVPVPAPVDEPGPHVLGVRVPSLSDVFATMGGLSERVGLPNANHVLDDQFDKLVQKLNVVIPDIETLGFEVKNFEVEWTVPPQIRVRLISSESVSDAEYAYVLSKAKGDLVLESIILSLGSVHKIQSAGNLAPFRRAQLEVDLAIPPRVVMTFTDPTNSFHDRFLSHHEALLKEMNEAKAHVPPPPVAIPTTPDGLPLPPGQ